MFCSLYVCTGVSRLGWIVFTLEDCVDAVLIVSLLYCSDIVLLNFPLMAERKSRMLLFRKNVTDISLFSVM